MAVDPTYNVSNYQEQGGARWVVAGELRIETGGKITPPGGTQATAIASMLDNSSGSSGGTLTAVGATNGSDVSAAINNNFASLSTKLNLVIAAVHGVGITA